MSATDNPKRLRPFNNVLIKHCHGHQGPRKGYGDKFTELYFSVSIHINININIYTNKNITLNPYIKADAYLFVAIFSMVFFRTFIGSKHRMVRSKKKCPYDKCLDYMRWGVCF